jgi:hypothetical protein
MEVYYIYFYIIFFKKSSHFGSKLFFLQKSSYSSKCLIFLFLIYQPSYDRIFSNKNLKIIPNKNHLYFKISNNLFSERAGIFTLILYDLILYRQKNAILSPNNRCLFVCCAHELMPAVGLPVSEQLPLYVLAEQAIIRQFMVALPYDLLPMASIFGPKNSNPENLNKFNLFAPPSKFFNQPDASSICPEVGKLLLIYVIMAYKFTGKL